ncbi:MAG: hypothetical protein IPM64_01825 [Phycisphaerales bacterium]|nr:hypothetical protein [Phycisphaerales bacterium]
MAAPLRIRQVTLRPLDIPMRLRFEHAAAARSAADPLIVEIQAAAPYAQLAGFGETLVRVYVTGETIGSALDDIRSVFLPRLLEFRPTSFPEALEFIESLPFEHSGRVINGARAAVELALLDLAGQAFRRRAVDAAGWLGLPGFGSPGSLGTARYSGIVVGRSATKLRWMLRLQRWAGLRDFKIKVAVDGWEEQLGRAHHELRRGLEKGRLTLRADANSGWDAAAVRLALPVLEAHGVCALEQPLPDAQDDFLPLLAAETRMDLIADESLLTMSDLRRLIEGGGTRVMNIRIAKNGGLLPSLQLAAATLAAGLDVQLGCLVGETSILTAAGAAFVEACPKVRFLEGAFGRILLRDDVIRRPLTFSIGGQLRSAPAGFGLGLSVEAAALDRLAADRPVNLPL